MKKLVREHIFEKFTEDSDPITDMGIGLNTQIIIDKIMTEDKKHSLYLNPTKSGHIYQFIVTGAVGRNKQHLVGSYFKIVFGTGSWDRVDFYFPPVNGKRKKMAHKYKGEYFDQIIRDAELRYIFDDYTMDHHTNTVVSFRIKPEYKKFFKPGQYIVK